MGKLLKLDNEEENWNIFVVERTKGQNSEKETQKITNECREVVVVQWKWGQGRWSETETKMFIAIIIIWLCFSV